MLILLALLQPSPATPDQVDRLREALTASTASIPLPEFADFGRKVAIDRAEATTHHRIETTLAIERRSIESVRRPSRGPAAKRPAPPPDPWSVAVPEEGRVPLPGAEVSPCGACRGKGSRACAPCGGSGRASCPACAGSGRAACARCAGSASVVCGKCGGEGRFRMGTYLQECLTCGKTGRRPCEGCAGGAGPCASCRGAKSPSCGACGGAGSSRCGDCDAQGFVEETLEVVSRIEPVKRVRVVPEAAVPIPDDAWTEIAPAGDLVPLLEAERATTDRVRAVAQRVMRAEILSAVASWDGIRFAILRTGPLTRISPRPEVEWASRRASQARSLVATDPAAAKTLAQKAAAADPPCAEAKAALEEASRAADALAAETARREADRARLRWTILGAAGILAAGVAVMAVVVLRRR